MVTRLEGSRRRKWDKNAPFGMSQLALFFPAAPPPLTCARDFIAFVVEAFFFVGDGTGSGGREPLFI